MKWLMNKSLIECQMRTNGAANDWLDARAAHVAGINFHPAVMKSDRPDEFFFSIAATTFIKDPIRGTRSMAAPPNGRLLMSCTSTIPLN